MPRGPAHAHTALGGGGEFNAIRDLLARWGDRARDIGDDAAVVELAPGAHLVASTDASVEGVHFRPEWFTPAEIGWRAAMSALSDVAAMAARPVGLLLAVVVPFRWRGALGALGDGVGEAAAAVQCPIIGGDLTAGADLALTVTVLGETARPVRRDGARPGDALYVTGRLGGPRRALDALLRGDTPHPADRDRFARPRARVAEAWWLADRGAHALIDVSDGLLAEAEHVAAASQCGVVLDGTWIPRVDRASLGDALTGGEEYELLCAAPADLDTAAFERRFRIPLTRVGEVFDRGDRATVALRNAARVDLPPGHDHFSG